jgi:hypothetical protein
MKLPVKKGWISFEDDAARNWTQAGSGQAATNARQGNSARVMENLAHGVNHLLAKNPRPEFGKSQHVTTADSTGADPLYRWRYDDSIDNEITRRVTIIAVPRTLSTNAATNASQWGTANHYNVTLNPFTGSTNSTFAAVNKYWDVFEDEYIVERSANGVPMDAEIDDGISTFGGYTILSASVQSHEIYTLDSDRHIVCDPALAKKAKPVLADTNPDIRAQLDELRRTNLPIVASWAAMGTTANATPPGDGTGLTLVNTAYTNLFDQNITVRNSDTPGAFYDAQYCGRGDTNYVDGVNVKVLCRFLAKSVTFGPASGDTNLLVKSTESVAGNEIRIPITANQAVDWVGNADHFVYFDSNLSPTAGSVNVNKLDFQGMVQNSGDYINVYGIRCWIVYS